MLSCAVRHAMLLLWLVARLECEMGAGDSDTNRLLTSRPFGAGPLHQHAPLGLGPHYVSLLHALTETRRGRQRIRGGPRGALRKHLRRFEGLGASLWANGGGCHGVCGSLGHECGRDGCRRLDRLW